jgi:phosphatidylglycerophosphatase A
MSNPNISPVKILLFVLIHCLFWSLELYATVIISNDVNRHDLSSMIVVVGVSLAFVYASQKHLVIIIGGIATYLKTKKK